VKALAERFQLVQYDGRGQGMSSRGLPGNHSLLDHLRDLNAVVGRLHLNRFVLIAGGWSGHVAVRFAIENVRLVEALVLQAVPANGAAWSTSLFVELATRDWDAFVRNMAAQGQPDIVSASISRLKQTTNQEDYLAIARSYAASDISDLLPRLKTPTLVTHPRDLFSVATEESLKVAGMIPDARLTMVAGATAPGDANQECQAIEEFLRSLPHTEERGHDLPGEEHETLSGREVEVLRLLAAGRSNAQIAEALVISQNTVIRHVSNIFSKIGAANRTEASVYARDHGIA